MNRAAPDPLDPTADLTTKTPKEIEQWRLEQSRRNHEMFPDPPVGPFSREKGRINATWPTEPWDFPLTPGSLVQITSNSTSPRLMSIRGLRRVDDGRSLAVLVSDDDGMLGLRHRSPSESWGDDVSATSVTISDPNILLLVCAWVVEADTDPLPAPPSAATMDLMAQTKGVHGQR